jgi:predicted DNA-binding protein
MATPKVKTTYALDAETVQTLERMARRWGTSKSEALRRAIRAAAETASDAPDDVVAALDRLQRAAALRASGARAWAQKARAERRAASARREATSE